MASNATPQRGLKDVFGRAVQKGTENGVKGYVQNQLLYNDESPIAPDTMEFWFRPAQIYEQVPVQYDSATPIGMSNDYRTYRSTGSFQYRFEIYWNALMMLADIGNSADVPADKKTGAPGRREGSADDMAVISYMIEQDRRWLEALTLPSMGNVGLVGTAPPTCILVIPGIVTMRCRLINLQFDFVQSDIRGNHKELSAQTGWEEAPLGRITMEDQLTNGSFRNWG